MKTKLPLIFLLSSFALLALVAESLQASIYWPLQVESASRGFATVQSEVRLVINDHPKYFPKTMTIDYLQNAEHQIIVLTLVEKRVGGCGSTHYYADYQGQGAPRPLDFHYNVHLVDHSTRRCRDLRPFLWEAEVKSGVGRIGNQDAQMTLSGNPPSPFID